MAATLPAIPEPTEGYEYDKQCKKCGEIKSSAQFGYYYSTRKDGSKRKDRRATCLTCQNAKFLAEDKDTQRKRYADNNRRYKAKIWAEVVTAYGGTCKCCGETEECFLQIDHVNDDGAKHRAELRPYAPKSFAGQPMYLWLKKNNYPSDYQLLCANCNFAKSRRGSCPHKRNEVVEGEHSASDEMVEY